MPRGRVPEAPEGPVLPGGNGQGLALPGPARVQTGGQRQGRQRWVRDKQPRPGAGDGRGVLATGSRGTGREERVSAPGARQQGRGAEPSAGRERGAGEGGEWAQPPVPAGWETSAFPTPRIRAWPWADGGGGGPSKPSIPQPGDHMCSREGDSLRGWGWGVMMKPVIRFQAPHRVPLGHLGMSPSTGSKEEGGSGLVTGLGGGAWRFRIESSEPLPSWTLGDRQQDAESEGARENMAGAKETRYPQCGDPMPHPITGPGAAEFAAEPGACPAPSSWPHTPLRQWVQQPRGGTGWGTGECGATRPSHPQNLREQEGHCSPLRGRPVGIPRSSWSPGGLWELCEKRVGCGT